MRCYLVVSPSFNVCLSRDPFSRTSKKRKSKKHSKRTSPGSSSKAIGALISLVEIIAANERHKDYLRYQAEAEERLREYFQALGEFMDLSPGEFEAYIAFIFEKMGYQISLRGGSGDQGVDIEARREDEYIIIQCKKYSSGNVGGPDVLKLIGSVTNERANKGILVTTSDFTSQAREIARGNPIELVNQAGIVAWQKQNKIGPYAEEPILMMLEEEMQQKF